MIEIDLFDDRYQEGVVDVILPIQQKEFGIPITLGDQPDLIDIPGFYRKGKGNFWVALQGREVVGTIALIDLGRGQGALRKMFVKKTYRGEGFRVADALLKTLMNWCRDQNVHQVFLGTTEKFLAAHRFYEKKGFSHIDKSDLPPGFPIMVVDTKFYTIETMNYQVEDTHGS